MARKEELSAVFGWLMVYSIMQVLEAEGSTIGEVPRKASPGGKIWHPSGLLSSVQAMYDGHSHLDRWSVEVGKREARERLAAMPYETVTSYCFSKRWLDSKRQDWWPTSRGPLKQSFGVHPTEASDTGLTHMKYEDLKRYVQGVNCVAVGEIGLDHVRVRQVRLSLLVDLTQTVAGLVGQQLDEAVGQEKMSSDVEPGDGPGNRGRLLRRHSL